MTGAAPLRVLILGATSGIAEKTARLYAAEGAALVLAGRRLEILEEIAADLRLRGAAKVEVAALDLGEVDPTPTLAGMIGEAGLDHIILAYGTLGDQAAAQAQVAIAHDIARVNYQSAQSWMLAAAEYFRARGRGSLVVLGSVAGDRGRRSNFIYGASKAAMATLVEGLDHFFAGTAVRVVVVKPGPTYTAMTAGMKRGGPLWSTPEQVARVVRRAADRGGPTQYAPARWRLIMLIIRMIPRPIFAKLNL